MGKHFGVAAVSDDERDEMEMENPLSGGFMERGETPQTNSNDFSAFDNLFNDPNMLQDDMEVEEVEIAHTGKAKNNDRQKKSTSKPRRLSVVENGKQKNLVARKVSRDNDEGGNKAVSRALSSTNGAFEVEESTGGDQPKRNAPFSMGTRFNQKRTSDL